MKFWVGVTPVLALVKTHSCFLPVRQIDDPQDVIGQRRDRLGLGVLGCCEPNLLAPNSVTVLPIFHLYVPPPWAAGNLTSNT